MNEIQIENQNIIQLIRQMEIEFQTLKLDSKARKNKKLMWKVRINREQYLLVFYSQPIFTHFHSLGPDYKPDVEKHKTQTSHNK